MNDIRDHRSWAIYYLANATADLTLFDDPRLPRDHIMKALKELDALDAKRRPAAAVAPVEA